MLESYKLLETLSNNVIGCRSVSIELIHESLVVQVQATVGNRWYGCQRRFSENEVMFSVVGTDTIAKDIADQVNREVREMSEKDLMGQTQSRQ